MAKRIDLTNQVFGRLLVLFIDWIKTNQKKDTYWWCLCECGNIVSVRLSNLKNGSTKSCGCFNREALSKRNRMNLTGKQFGRLIVLWINEELSKEKGRIYWVCRCSCGCIVSIRAKSLQSGATKSCGCLLRETASNLNLGEKCNFWKGGVTSENHLIRTSTKYKEFIKKVIKRDSYTCRYCDKKGSTIQVHHIKSFANFPEHRFDMDNAITLCEECHIGKKTKNPNAFHKLYGDRNFTEENFYEWFNKFSTIEKVG